MKSRRIGQRVFRLNLQGEPMMMQIFEWMVVGGAAWVVVEDEATRYAGRPMSKFCVPIGGRTARYCAEGVLRQHRSASAEGLVGS